MGSRDRGCKGHWILRRVPVDGRYPGSHEPSPFTRRWGRRSWRLPPLQSARESVPNGWEERRGDRDIRGSIATGAVGRNTPTPYRAGRRVSGLRVRIVDPPKRSTGVVKRSVPRSSRAEPRLCGASTRRKSRQRTGNARGAGKRNRTGGRSRSDASRVLLAGRSQGLVAARRALAGRKLEAPPDAGHEQREGEPVRGVMTFPITGTRDIGLWVSARRLTRRRKAFSGTHVSGPHRQGTQGPLASRSSCVERSARNAPPAAHRAVRRPTRACLRVTRECQRSTRVGEGSTRIEKVRGESASSALKRRRSSGAPDRARPKLATANSVADPSPP
jgi:hypothetical protein